MQTKLYIYTDGGSRGNPGHSAIGILILDENKKILLKYKRYIGINTNNQAEYRALIKGLELAKRFTKDDICCFLDSELVVRQLNGKYKIRNNDLLILFNELKKHESIFKKVTYVHVKRENTYIQMADAMVNEALDELNLSTNH